MPSRQSVEEFRAANQGISDLMADDLTGLWGSLNLSRPEQARDVLLSGVPQLASRYGDIAAMAAGDWYTQERASSVASGTFRAVLAPSVPADAVESTVRYAAGHLFTDAPTGALDYLRVQTNKYSLQPGRDTIAYNAQRDNARWARVPRGLNTCAFCLAMASRGFVYSSSGNAGEHGQYHGDCHCITVPEWSRHPSIDGYDPSEFTSQYADAEKAAGTSDLGSVLSALRQQQGIS